MGSFVAQPAHRETCQWDPNRMGGEGVVKASPGEGGDGGSGGSAATSPAGQCPPGLPSHQHWGREVCG